MKTLLQRLPVLNAFLFALVLSGSLILLDTSPAWAAKCKAEVTCGDGGGKVSCEAEGQSAQCRADTERGEVYCNDAGGSTWAFCQE